MKLERTEIALGAVFVLFQAELDHIKLQFSHPMIFRLPGCWTNNCATRLLR